MDFILQPCFVQLCDKQWFTEEEFCKHFVMSVLDYRCREIEWVTGEILFSSASFIAILL